MLPFQKIVLNIPTLRRIQIIKNVYRYKNMSLRFCIVVIRLSVLLLLASVFTSMAVAQQDANVNSQEKLLTVPAVDVNMPIVNQATDSNGSLVDMLELKMYEVAAGDLLTCVDGGKYCLEHAESIKGLLCAANACNGTDNSTGPVDCFERIAQRYSVEKKEQFNSALCSLIKSPSAETRRVMLNYVPEEGTEDRLVEHGAYLMALKESALSCEDYIKNYVGGYGSQWNQKWYRALSGCRILAHESTREQEEKDFHTWFRVVQGVDNCSNILNSEMRDACSAPGAASPAPSFIKSPSIQVQ